MRKITKIVGTTEVCLADFYRRFGRSELLTEFAHVTPGTEITWRKHGTMPTGETLLRLRAFLYECEYGLDELKVADPILGIALCVAHGCIGMEDVGVALDMSDGKQFFSYFRGTMPSLQRVDALAQLWAKHRAELEKRQKSFREKLVKAGIVHNGNGENKLIQDFTAACEQVLKLGRSLLEGTLEQRMRMRQSIGIGQEPVLHCTWETLNKLLNENNSETTKRKL